MSPRSSTVLLVFLCLWATAASAGDLGLPMIGISMTGLALGLVPIILLEGLTFRRSLDIDWTEAWTTSSAANLASTLVAVPLAWTLMFAISLATGGPSGKWETFSDRLLSVTRDAAWINDYEPWQTPVAQLFLLIPYFFATWWIETRVVARMSSTDITDARRACLRANLITYAAIAAVSLVGLVFSLTPDVSRQELEELKANYSDELKVLPQILSVALSEAPTASYSEIDQLRERWVLEAKNSVDCAVFGELVLVVSDAPVFTGSSFIHVCHESPVIVNWSRRAALQTEYGDLSVGFEGQLQEVRYKFVLMQDTSTASFTLYAIVDGP